MTITNAKEKTAYTEQWQSMAAANKQQVMQLLGWDELQYCEFQYKMGIAYLMWYMPCNEKGRQQLERSKLFWNWWKHCWCKYDDSWLSFKRSLNESSYKTIYTSYTQLHCSRAKAIEIKPNKIVLAELKKQSNETAIRCRQKSNV